MLPGGAPRRNTGSPLRNGTGFRHYTPSTDATLVTRTLEAGALLVGKAQNEYMCLSGSSHTSFFSPVLNPLTCLRSWAADPCGEPLVPTRVALSAFRQRGVASSG